MGSKSDFAEKLLRDLRLRKERMYAGENVSRSYSSQMSAGFHGNAAQSHRTARQINALEYQAAVSRTASSIGDSNRYVNAEGSSNQIVLYEGAKNARQLKDLSMAIAFAFENTANLSKLGSPSSTNPLVNFFNRFNCRKMDITATSSDNQSLSACYYPTVSHVHISEVSKGIQKLNQILKSCSGGFNYDRNASQVGRELLKGAIDLEQALRMLVSLQEASAYTNTTEQKTRLRLLEEDQENNNSTVKQADLKQVDRPRFSFDKPSKSKMTHKRSVSCLPDFESLSDKVKLKDSPQPTREKARISNVVAKLMGLEELPQKDDHMKQKDLSSKQKKDMERKFTTEIKNGSLYSNDTKSIKNNTTPPPLRDINFDIGDEKRPKIPQGSPKVVNSGRNAAPKDLKVPCVRMDAASETKITTKKQKSVSVVPIQVSRFQELHDSEKKQTFTEDRDKRHTETRGKLLVSSVEFQQAAQKKHQVQPAQVEVLKKPEKRRQGKNRVEKKEQHLQKQKLVGRKHEGPKVEPTISSKDRSAASLQKKQKRDKPAPENGISKKQNGVIDVKDQPNSRNVSEDDQSQKSDHENFQKQDKSQDVSPREQPSYVEKASDSTMLVTQEKPTDVLSKQKKAISKEIQKNENPRKIDLVMTRRSGKVDQLTKSLKKSDEMLQELKQKLQRKNSRPKVICQQSDNKINGVEEGGIVMSDLSGNNINEPAKQQDKLQNEGEQVIKLKTFHGDVHKEHDMMDMPALNDNYDDISSNSEKISDEVQTVEMPFASTFNEELKQYDQSCESRGPCDFPKPVEKLLPPPERQEQLTEPEKELKETIIKSQQFLNTAEALFRLNIPLTFLHAGDHNYEVEDKKLILDCGHEVMKRKARQNEATLHAYTTTSISRSKIRSLDDLVKQLCRDFETLEFYGGTGRQEDDIADALCRMLERDIYNEEPDVNSMWDLEWDKMMMMFCEKEDVVRDVEKHMLNGLLDEITSDLLLMKVSA